MLLQSIVICMYFVYLTQIRAPLSSHMGEPSRGLKCRRRRCNAGSETFGTGNFPRLFGHFPKQVERIGITIVSHHAWQKFLRLGRAVRLLVLPLVTVDAGEDRRGLSWLEPSSISSSRITIASRYQEPNGEAWLPSSPAGRCSPGRCARDDVVMAGWIEVGRVKRRSGD
jgi:hypothetical protein